MNKFVQFSVLAVFLFGCRGEPEKPSKVVRKVKVAQVRPIGQLASRRYPGIAKGADEVDLSFRVSGVLEKRPIQQGFLVKKGDLLAQLEQQDFIEKVSSVQGRLESAKAEHVRAEADYERVFRLQQKDKGAIDQRSVDRAKQELESVSARVRTLEAELTTAKNNLSYSTLIAPFDARVIEIFTENYQRVSEGEKIVRLINYGVTEVELSVPEVVMPLLDDIDKIEAFFEVYPDKIFSAYIWEVGAEASTTTRTYPVTLRLEEVEEVIYPGMAGYGQLFFRRQPSTTVLIPETSQMIDDGGHSYVWVVSGTNIEKRKIEIQGLTPEGLAVRSGIQEGELVVSSGAERLQVGQQVTPLQTKGWP